MTSWTLTQIKGFIQEKLDLQDEVMITATELTDYINQAIGEAAQEVIKINEDYFLDYADLALVSGTEEYTVPTGIFANKIRSMIYRNGTDRYEITRIRDWKKFLIKVENDVSGAALLYQYFIVNKASGGEKIVLSPPSRETSMTNVKVWYIRDPKILATGSDACDVPEGLNFVLQKTKELCLAKINGGTAPTEAIAETKLQKDLFVSSLTERTPDNANEVEMDLSHYTEHN